METKFGIFRADCFDTLLVKQDFSQQELIAECGKFTLNKGISYAIIGGSAIFKLPQVSKIVNSGSVEGISAIMYYTETIGFVNTSANSMHLNLPFSVYGEALIIIVQNLLITLLIWKYDKNIGFLEKIAFLVFITGYMVVLFQDTMIPEESWKLISSSTIIFGVISRVPQILSNFASGSTGQLSFVTFFLAWTGTVARSATVFAETDDFWYRLPFMSSLAFNTIILLQFFLYWSVKPTKVSDDKADQLAFDISQQIMKDMQYPGHIKVTVIREKRAIAYAK